MPDSIYFRLIKQSRRYHIGLNTLENEGDLFYTSQTIFSNIYYDYGDYICIITMTKDANVVRRLYGYKSTQIIVEKIMPLLDVYTLQYLGSLGAYITSRSFMYGVLTAAYQNGYMDVVKYLVSVGTDDDCVNDFSMRWAAQQGRLDIVKYLVSAGADIHLDDDFVLSTSAFHGHLHIIQYLVSIGVDIHIKNDDALQTAAHNGDLNIVQYLIDQGSDIRINDDYALRMALSNNHFKLVKYIVGSIKHKLVQLNVHNV